MNPPIIVLCRWHLLCFWKYELWSDVSVWLRVSRRSSEDGPLLEDQETEGQRQLHSLLLQQLHTNVDFDRSENILFIFSIWTVNVKQVQQYNVENNEGKKKHQ